MHDSLFYLPGAVLSQSELSSARLDGLVFEVGAGYMPADIPEGPCARVTAIKKILRAGFAASGSTAAWIHGVGDAPPLQHHIQRTVDRRPRVKTALDVVVHESRLPADHIVWISGAPVASPLRTLTDLALGADRYPDYLFWLELLAAETPTLVPVAQEQLIVRERLPGRRAALARLEQLSARMRHEDVTR